MNLTVLLSPKRTSRISEAAARTAFIGSLAVVGILGSLHVLSPEFDPSFRMVSEYARGRHGEVLSLMFATWGVSTWALAVAIWSERPATTGGRIGRWCLLAAGLGEILAAVFDVTHELGHGVAGLLGVVGLPVAAVLVSASLNRRGPWTEVGGQLRRWSAHATWMAVVLLIMSMALMTAQFAHVSGGHLPRHAPTTLPPGIWGVAGWANRLIVVANCWWAAVVSWQAIRVERAESGRGITHQATSPLTTTCPTSC